LVKKGFQVMMFDYSGFGFSEGEPTVENARIDALAAVDYALSREDVKGTKLVLYGQSFGGHLSAIVATERQDKIDALVMEGAYSSPKDIAANRVPVLGRIFVKQKYAAKKIIKDFHKPVLIIHSSEDKEIPFFMGQKLFDSANNPKTFLKIQNCHICGPIFYPDEISDKITEMLR
jgi:fermentation-respiration switch protein FrsA (DUF1100 family)